MTTTKTINRIDRPAYLSRRVLADVYRCIYDAGHAATPEQKRAYLVHAYSKSVLGIKQLYAQKSLSRADKALLKVLLKRTSWCIEQGQSLQQAATV